MTSSCAETPAEVSTELDNEAAARDESSAVRRRWGGALAAALVLVGLALPWLLPRVPQALADRVVGGPGTTAAAGMPLAQLGAPDPVIPDRLVAAQQAWRTEGRTRHRPAPGRPAQRRAEAGPPVGLDVPALKISAPVVRISGNNGVLLPPADPRILGWWQEGADAGARHGATVITGHTVHTGGGSFDHLDALRPGDRVLVRTPRGSLRYVVRRVRVLATRALARRAGQLFALDGRPRLVLVTCDDWNGSEYLSNAVVVAAPVAR